MSVRWAVGLLLAVVALMGCAGGHNTVTGRINPEHFEFTPIVKKSGPRGEPAGWWAVCIHALVTQGDSDAKSVCKFEVGMPQRNEEQGDISLEDAQDGAAEMANRAA